MPITHLRRHPGGQSGSRIPNYERPTCGRKLTPGRGLKVNQAVGRRNHRVTPAKLLNEQRTGDPRVVGIQGWNMGPPEFGIASDP